MINAHAKFKVASFNGLGGDAFTRKYVIRSLTMTLVGSRSHETLPSNLYVNLAHAHATIEVATSSG